MSFTSSAPLTSSSTSTFRPGRAPTAGATDSDVGGVFNTPIFKGMLVGAGVAACVYGGYVGWEAYKSYKGKHDSDSQNDETATDGDSKKATNYSDGKSDNSASTDNHSYSLKELTKRGIPLKTAQKIANKSRPAQEQDMIEVAAYDAEIFINSQSQNNPQRTNANSKKSKLVNAIKNKRTTTLTPNTTAYDSSNRKSRYFG